MMVGTWELLFLIGILVVVVLPVAVGAVALWVYLARRAPRRRSPLDIARERYALGEIDRAQFEQLRQDLQASRPPESPLGP